MEKKKKGITFEQIMAAALLIYKKSINKLEILDLISLFQCEDEFEFINSSITDLSSYVYYDGKSIELKNGLEYNMPLYDNPNITLSERLIQIAGESALNYVNFFVSKSCMNCVNPACRVPYKEKLGHDENDMPQGNKCLGWRNIQYKKKVLSKIR